MITLGIIGVVAAITLPILVNNYQKKVTVSRLKKSYSLVANMIMKAEAEHGPIAEWSEWTFDKSWYSRGVAGLEVFKKYLAPHVKGKIMENYDDPTSNYFDTFMCYRHGTSPLQLKQNRSVQYVHPNNKIAFALYQNSYPNSMLLPDGTCVGWNSSYDHIVAEIYIDINGSSTRPNMLGKDFFIFEILKNGKLVPKGLNASDADMEKNCSSKSNAYTGNYCAAKIMNAGWHMDKSYFWK